MHDDIIAAVFDTAERAHAAVHDLRAAGIPEADISVHASTGAAGAPHPAREGGFWSTLFGGDPGHDATVYDRSIESGATVVTVRASAETADHVLELLEQHGPIDIDERTSTYGLSATDRTSALSASGTVGNAVTAPGPVVGAPALSDTGETIQLAQEELAVGKRVVNRGGTRVRRFVVETPVEQQVRLREETVTLERRPVTDGQVVANADFGTKTIEMVQTGEEAVVSKTARVVEEVALRKQSTERVDTVKDTVRRDEIEVEQIPAQPVSPNRPL